MRTTHIQVAVNGSRSRRDHPAVPLAPDEIAADLLACARAGAASVHVHPRSQDGLESLQADVVTPLLDAARRRMTLPVGLTTELSIEGDAVARLKAVRAWRVLPDIVTVNVAEPGWLALSRQLIDRGVALEAGLWSVEDAEVLASAGLERHLARVLVEPFDASADDVLLEVAEIHHVLDRRGIEVPRLQHTENASAWDVVEDGIRRGVQVRVGLEDELHLPDGTPAASNADLVRAARQLL